MNYTFKHIDNCNMCGDPTTGHKLLGQRFNKSQGLWPKSNNGISTSVMKCTECGLVYNQPMPIPEILEIIMTWR